MKKWLLLELVVIPKGDRVYISEIGVYSKEEIVNKALATLRFLE